MERNAVLAKTPKGQAEVKSRAHGLARKLRALLIMVDGSATVGAILAKSGGDPDAEAALESLVSQGFVEVAGAGAAPASSPPPAARRAPPPDKTQPIPLGATQPLRSPAAPEQSREQAMAALLDLLAGNLGSADRALAEALERARTRDEFHAVAERCAHALAAAEGASTAQAFRDRAKAYLDTYVGGS